MSTDKQNEGSASTTPEVVSAYPDTLRALALLSSAVLERQLMWKNLTALTWLMPFQREAWQQAYQAWRSAMKSEKVRTEILIAAIEAEGLK